MPGKCHLCKVEMGDARKRACIMRCVNKEAAPEESAWLRDFTELNPDGVDYRNTDHPRYSRMEGEKEDWLTIPGWADIISGRCKCKQCEQARFAHTVKQMIIESKKQLHG